MEIRELKTSGDFEIAYPVMKELRTHLSFNEFRALYEAASLADQYTLVGAFEGCQCLAVMGFRLLYDFVHGKHLYIDDLVVTQNFQSKGFGAQLLSYAEERARNEGCQGLRLCTGKENERGIRFYEREGWLPRAIAFKKQL